MVRGKVTPLHTHPADETMYMLEGEILMHMDGQEYRVAAGGLAFAPRGVPHAFMVLSDVARLITIRTPARARRFTTAQASLPVPMAPAPSISTASTRRPPRTAGSKSSDRLHSLSPEPLAARTAGPAISWLARPSTRPSPIYLLAPFQARDPNR